MTYRHQNSRKSNFATEPHVVLRRRVARSELLHLIAMLPPALIGMKACGSAHDWARRFREHGYDVRLMAPQFVNASVKSPKHDARDAEAICEAVTRPTMRFVPIKQLEQQDLQALHRVRERLVKARTALGHGHDVRHGRQVAAWLVLVPRQYSSGGKTRFAGISKRGNRDLRCLLMHSARSVVSRARMKTDAMSVWIRQLVVRAGVNKACVAVANKMARVAWALLRTGEHYRQPEKLQGQVA